MLTDFTLNSLSLTSSGPWYCLVLILVPSLYVPRQPVHVFYLFKPPTSPPPSLPLADGAISHVTEKTEVILPIPYPTTTCLCPYSLLLGPILSDLPKDINPASVLFFLEQHQLSPLYWIILISVQACCYFAIWKKKKTLTTLLYPIYLFPLTAKLKTWLFSLCAVSPLNPPFPTSTSPKLLLSSHQWLHTTQVQRAVPSPHLIDLPSPFLSMYAWGVHSRLCVWRTEWGSGFMKLNLWNMNKPIYKNVSCSYSPICLLWVNDDLWQSSSKEC